MKHIHKMTLLISLCNFFISCSGQANERNQPNRNTKKTIAENSIQNFENSEFTYYGIPKKISSIDTSAGWKQKGQKILLTGRVFKQDGKTPAAGVLMYYYQTNTEGRYVHKPEEARSMSPNNLGQTHGYIRGWVKTAEDGKYFIYTIRPGTYPDSEEPAHVHVTVKEPGDLKEYYIDDFVFEDDPFLTINKRQKLKNRGGAGIVKLEPRGNIAIGERNIILGLNIPGYPGQK
jgi:protocatechuate 3,4-dioxygenase, beta subunit